MLKPASYGVAEEKPEVSLRKAIKQELSSLETKILPKTTVVVQFKPRSGHMTPPNQLQEQLKHRLDVKGFKIVRLHAGLWPDENMQGEQGENLTESRYRSIRREVRQAFPGLDIVTYDMSDPANWLERFIGVNEQKVKRAMKGDSEEIDIKPKLQTLAKIFERHGESGKAVIAAEMRKANSHE